MGRRIIGFLSTLALLAGAGGATGVASQAASIKSGETGVRFTSKTVTISRSTVRKNLIGIAADGTFTFKRAAGGRRQLRARAP